MATVTCEEAAGLGVGAGAGVGVTAGDGLGVGVTDGDGELGDEYPPPPHAARDTTAMMAMRNGRHRATRAVRGIGRQRTRALRFAYQARKRLQPVPLMH